MDPMTHIIERRAARRYWHMTPWKSCMSVMRGFCLRCAWRTVTGQHRRAKAAHIARIKSLPPGPIVRWPRGR